MKIELTVFKSIFDNETTKTIELSDFNKFEQLLRSLSQKPGYKPSKDERTDKGSVLISPAVYNENRRLNTNVRCWAGWAAVDVDDYEGSFDDHIDSFREWKFICYSTASSTQQHPKCRLVFPLTRHVQPDEIRHFWFALNRELGDIGDGQCKDFARMYYVPAIYPNAYNFMFTNEGKIVDPSLLMIKHPYVRKKTSTFNGLSDQMQATIVAYRRDKLTNTNFTWSSYHDCPFVSKKLITEYKGINQSGWYNCMFRIMVSIASVAIKKGYPITANEIADLCTGLDRETGNWYQNRPMQLEAERALTFALTSS